MTLILNEAAADDGGGEFDLLVEAALALVEAADALEGPVTFEELTALLEEVHLARLEDDELLEEGFSEARAKAAALARRLGSKIADRVRKIKEKVKVAWQKHKARKTAAKNTAEDTERRRADEKRKRDIEAAYGERRRKNREAGEKFKQHHGQGVWKFHGRRAEGFRPVDVDDEGNLKKAA